MSQAARTEARFVSVPARAAHYESFYLKATRPGGGRALWIRHTVHKPPGAEPTGALWLTFFSADAPEFRATKARLGAEGLSAPPGSYIEVGDAAFGPGFACGRIADGDLEASWELSFPDGSDPLRHLPSERFYRSRLPKTKLLSPYPCTSFTGWVEIGGERLELAAWPGMVGHNWGSEHAERWVWIQAQGLGGNPGDYIDLAAGRIKIGPVTTPWIANGQIVIGGEPHRLGGIGHAYGTEISEGPGACEFTLPGKNVNVRGRVSAPLHDFVGWIYADPVGPEHNAINCSIADIEFKVERPGHKHARFALERAAVYELGMRESDHGVAMQPFPDG